MFSVLFIVIAAILFFLHLKKKKTNIFKQGSTVAMPRAPGPVPWPVLGSLHLLGKHESPFQSFTALAKEYGDIFSVTLGSTKCLVVNNLELIREVLNQNGKFFGGRPDFIRFNMLFAGDRNNSLALCDWSDLQGRRRKLARRYCGPKQHTDNFARIGTVASFEVIELIQTIKDAVKVSGFHVNIKPIIMTTAMNMFTQYMCNVRFDPETDVEFRKIVDHFDEIFWEINQGYAVDFLPWLAPFYRKHMEKLSGWSQDIRSFILSKIVEPRENNLVADGPEIDFLDGLLRVLHDDPTVDRDTVIFMLEDFLGGHSAVGNLVMLCLTAVARDHEVGDRILREILSMRNENRAVTLQDRDRLPYTEATVLECLRYSSSPIVPHVATENTSVAGYGIEQGTVVFINNYELNTSEKYWRNPEAFNPARFLERSKVRVNRICKCDPCKFQEEEKEVFTVKRNIPHFLPFSIGKRTCIGQTLVTTMTFVMFANIIREFHVTPVNREDLKQKIACVALPKDTYKFKMIPIPY